MVEVADAGQFVPNQPPIVEPVPNRGFVGGGSVDINTTAIHAEQITIYELGRNGPIRY